MDDGFDTKIGSTVEGYLCFPAYFPSEGDTEPGPTLFLPNKPKEPHGFARIKRVQCTVLEDELRGGRKPK